MESLLEPLQSYYASLSPTAQTTLTIVLVLASIWLYTALMAHYFFPTILNSHILLLIAHPDDEAMFFSAPLQSLTHPRCNNTVKLLCLSNGNADGIGKVREKELQESAKLLGIDPRHVLCLDDPALQDSMSNTWDPVYISALLSRLLVNKSAPTAAASPGSGTPPSALNTDVILTFDERGVSGHPNHTACHAGAVHFAQGLARAHPGWRIPLAVYTLSSVSLARKFISIGDVSLSVVVGLVMSSYSAMMQSARRGGRQGPAEDKRVRPAWLLYVSGWGRLRTAQRAMYSAHKSQMRWFRWGWITVGRYMVLGDLKRVF